MNIKIHFSKGGLLIYVMMLSLLSQMFTFEPKSTQEPTVR